MIDTIHKPKYLLTIACDQKKEWVSEFELYQIQTWLEACGVHFLLTALETHGVYDQLHSHSLVAYGGLYKKLTKYGDCALGNSFHCNFQHIRKGSLPTVTSYILKNQYENCTFRNMCKISYYDQDKQLFTPPSL